MVNKNLKYYFLKMNCVKIESHCHYSNMNLKFFYIHWIHLKNLN